MRFEKEKVVDFSFLWARNQKLSIRGVINFGPLIQIQRYNFFVFALSMNNSIVFSFRLLALSA